MLEAAAVGTVRERTDREGSLRAWVKVAEPKSWKLRAVLIWEAANGPTPRGQVVHHVNRKALDDRLENLELLSRADHFREHRNDFEAERAGAALAARLRRTG